MVMLTFAEHNYNFKQHSNIRLVFLPGPPWKVKKRKRRVGLHIHGGDRCGNPKNQESGKEKSEKALSQFC